jgi:hypothetical protein
MTKYFRLNAVAGFILILALLSTGCNAQPDVGTISTQAAGTVIARLTLEAPPSATPTLMPTATQVPPTPTLQPTETRLPPTATATSPATTETPIPSAISAATLTLVPTGMPGSIQFPAIPNVKNPIFVYYIDPHSGGSAGCPGGSFGLSSGVSRSGDPVKDIKIGLQKLFANKAEYYGSFYNPLFRSNLKVSDVRLDHGLATVNLRGYYNPSDDVCDNLRVKAQIWDTIKQFRAVETTNIYFNGRPFGDRVSNDM